MPQHSTIIIFSSENDVSTGEVMRWLHRFDQDVVRINASAPLDELRLDGASFRFETQGRSIALEDVGAVWYRKGNFWFKNAFKNVHIEGNPTLTDHLRAIFDREDRSIKEYFHHLLCGRARTLGNPSASNINKLVTLDLARKAGFKTPDFVVSGDTGTFRQMLADGRKCITKAISDGAYLWDFEQSRTGYFTFTERVTETLLADLPDRIPPSFVQNEVEKSFELRVFCLDGEFFAMAIYSQADPKTQVDFRKYNFEKPNRSVPYRLSDEVQNKLRRVFSWLSLNTGSVDLLVDGEGEFWFLEINPVGQYDWLSLACNYELDRRIAHWLVGPHAR